jgi:hypothetical protein
MSAWKTIVELYWQGKLLILAPELSGNPISSHIAAKQEKLSSEIMNLALRSIFLRTSYGFLTCRKIFDMAPTALLSLRRNMCCRFLSPLKIHRPRPGFNPRTLGPMASTPAITLPRTANDDSFNSVQLIYLCAWQLRVFENRVLIRIFGHTRDEVKGEWRKLHNDELHNFYSSPNVIRQIK